MARYHKSNFGKFGESLPVDIDGYTHTTISGWLHANVDWGTRGPYRDKYEAASEMARDARAAIKRAESAVDDWQNS